MLEWQLRALAANGVSDITVVTGFGAEEVEQALRRMGPVGGGVRTLFNPFFAVVRQHRQLLPRARPLAQFRGGAAERRHALRAGRPAPGVRAPEAPITVTIDRKAAYDADDMKVSVDGTRLRAIGKTLRPDETDGESIGLLLFRGRGGRAFVEGVEAGLRQPDGLRRWYLSVIDALAPGGGVRVASIEGLAWGEIDYPGDIARAADVVRGWDEADPTKATASAAAPLAEALGSV